MQKCSDPSGFLVKSTGGPHRDEDGHIAPDSNNSSYYFLINIFSWGLCLYIDFCTGSAPSTRGNSCMFPSFHLVGARVDNVPGNISQHIYNTVHNDALFFSFTFSKCGIAPSGRSLSPYNIA